MFAAGIDFVRRWGGLLLVLLVLGGGLGLSPLRSSAQEPTQPQAPGAKLKELRKERLATARELMQKTALRVKNREGSIDQLREATRILFEAELDLCDSDKERVAVLEKFVAEAKKNEKLGAKLAQTGQGLESDALKAKADRLQSEIALEQARGKGAARPPEGHTAGDIQDQVALAEKQVAIKRAALKVAQAQKQKAVAELNTLKAQLVEASAAATLAEKQVKRLEDRRNQNAVAEHVVDEGVAKRDASRARLLTAEGKAKEGESQVAVEQARVELAQAEVDEVELRLKQLKARLQPR